MIKNEILTSSNLCMDNGAIFGFNAQCSIIQGHNFSTSIIFIKQNLNRDRNRIQSDAGVAKKMNFLTCDDVVEILYKYTSLEISNIDSIFNTLIVESFDNA